MDTSSSIVLNPDVLGGKPTVKGTRLSVELVMGLVHAGFTNEAIIASYPRLTNASIRACQEYAATGKPLSLTTWADFEETVFGPADCDANRCSLQRYANPD